MSWPSLPRNFAHIREVALQECHTLTMGQLLRTTNSNLASRLNAAIWLREQLPIRFARRIEDIVQLPHIVVINPHINAILQTYLHSFDALTSFPEVRNENDEEDFLELIKDLLVRHNPGTRQIAEGYRDVRRLYPVIRLDDFLQDHFTTRIATRILMDNFVLMRSPREGYLGVVRQGMRPRELVQEIASEIISLTTALYGKAPEVEYRGNPDCVLDYIPRHVKYMVRELLKNAFRSTVERHLNKVTENGRAGKVPPVVVEMHQGDIHVIIKISDHGGGMPKHIQKQAWQYGWTTVEPLSGQREAWQYAEESCNWERNAAVAARQPQRSELAGYGFGLPLTRLHAQYFGGDVFLQALPGHGTDLILVLTHLTEGTPATEIDDLSTILYNKENSSLTNAP